MADISDNTNTTVITVDGIEYKVSEFNESALRSLDHLYALDNQANRLRFELEQIDASKSVFERILRENLPTNTQ